jgi:hypothetical protein
MSMRISSQENQGFYIRPTRSYSYNCGWLHKTYNNTHGISKYQYNMCAYLSAT